MTIPTNNHSVFQAEEKKVSNPGVLKSKIKGGRIGSLHILLAGLFPSVRRGRLPLITQVEGTSARAGMNCR